MRIFFHKQNTSINLKLIRTRKISPWIACCASNFMDIEFASGRLLGLCKIYTAFISIILRTMMCKNRVFSLKDAG
jgi:hypothetical protein